MVVGVEAGCKKRRWSWAQLRGILLSTGSVGPAGESVQELRVAGVRFLVARSAWGVSVVLKSLGKSD